MIFIIVLILYIQSIICEFVNINPLSPERQNLAGTTLENNGLAFFGGGQQNYFAAPCSSIVDIYNYTNNSWTTNTLSVARQYLTATSLLNQIVFFAGGCNSDASASNVVDYYILKNNSWYTSQLSVPRFNLASTSINEIAIFAGGQDNINYYSTVDIYNFTSNTWTTAQLKQQRSNLVACTLKNYNLSFFAGGGMTTFLSNIVDVYNYTTGKWSYFLLKYPRSYFASAVLNKYGLILFAGGTTSNGNSGVEFYYASNNSLTYDTTISISTYSLASSSLEDYGLIFFAGGSPFSGEQSNALYVYSAKNNLWTTSQLSVPRSNFVGISLKNFIIFRGSSVNLYQNIDALSYCDSSNYLSIHPDVCKKCPEKYFCSGYTVSPTSCNIGYYCPIASSTITPCPVGTYGFKPISNINDCTPCPAGTFNNQLGGTLSSCLNCPTGFYCGTNYSIPTPCPSNHYCPTPAFKISCPIGTFYDGKFATSINFCKKCNIGFFCPGNGNKKTLCSNGYYSNKEGLAECIICPKGYFCPQGSINPILCNKNFISLDGSFACSQCKNNEYTNGPGEYECIICNTSQFDIKGWWCMTMYQRIVLVFLWIVTIGSSSLTIYKILNFSFKRIKIIKKNNLNLNIYNFIFLSKILKDLSNEFNDNTKLISNKLEIDEIKNNITKINDRLNELNIKVFVKN